jgi:predicted hydrolase (HD superfamily)
VGVGELVENGMGELRFADFNADGQLDSADIAAFMGGALPVTLADVNGDQAVDGLDVDMVKENLDTKGGASDVNRDGVVDSDDLVFVIENMGADVRR